MLRTALPAAMTAIPLVALLIAYAPDLLTLTAACLITATIAVSIGVAVARTRTATLRVDGDHKAPPRANSDHEGDAA